jgi:hypothetical protein
MPYNVLTPVNTPCYNCLRSFLFRFSYYWFDYNTSTLFSLVIRIPSVLLFIYYQVQKTTKKKQMQKKGRNCNSDRVICWIIQCISIRINTRIDSCLDWRINCRIRWGIDCRVYTCIVCITGVIDVDWRCCCWWHLYKEETRNYCRHSKWKEI